MPRRDGNDDENEEIRLKSSKNCLGVEEENYSGDVMSNVLYDWEETCDI